MNPHAYFRSLPQGPATGPFVAFGALVPLGAEAGHGTVLRTLPCLPRDSKLPRLAAMRRTT